MSVCSRSSLAAAALALALHGSAAFAASPLNVVASFSILGDFVQEVGGEHVKVTTLVGPNGDAHVYEPTPQDARDAAAADLVVVNGLGFEGWLDRLIEASGYKGATVITSDGVDPLRLDERGPKPEGTAHDAVDPHAWQSPANVEIYISNIAEALCAADRADCAEFRTNAAAYVQEVRTLDQSIKRGFAAIPAERRKLITSHDAFGYFARAYGVEVLAPEGVSTESEASAADVAALIRQIRGQAVTALFVENISDPRLIEQIARETGVRPGGELYSDALSEPDGPAATYLDMMRHNASVMQAAMQGS